MREESRQRCLFGMLVLLAAALLVVLFVDGVIGRDSYVFPTSCLGYRLNERITDDNKNIVEINRQDGLPVDSYEMRCTEDFGGVPFEKCTLGVDRRLGVVSISAQTMGGPEMFRRAVKRMNKVAGKPVVKEKEFVSWNYSGGELTLRCDHPGVAYDREGKVSVSYFKIDLVFMNPALAGR